MAALTESAFLSDSLTKMPADVRVQDVWRVWRPKLPTNLAIYVLQSNADLVNFHEIDGPQNR